MQTALIGHCIQAIKSVPEEQKEAVARGAKMRTLGNIRLIAELFKKSVVPEKIVHMCVSDLTGDAKQEPSENNVEVCTALESFFVWRSHLHVTVFVAII